MKKLSIMAAAVALAFSISAQAADDGVLTREGSTTVVNTTTLGSHVKGFRGPTPVKIYIRKNKITKVEALPNQETPKFFAKAKAMLAKYVGMSVKKASTKSVDGVTGATFSSRALRANVQAGAKYYLQHK